MGKVLESPISAAQAAQQGKQWAELQSAGDRLCWLEFDPDRGETRIRCRQDTADSVLLTPAGYSVRSRVHEYGGGSYRLLNDGLVFVNEVDQGLYWQHFDAPEPVALLYQAEGFRYGDLQFDPHLERILAVEEEHAEQGVVHNRLVAISLRETQGSAAERRRVLVEGADFYSAPRLYAEGSAPGSSQDNNQDSSQDNSQDNSQGNRLAWISWDHPHQPWTSTQLWLAELDPEGAVLEKRAITRGQFEGQDESVLQPEFGADGALFFISDRNGWWNLYRYRDGVTEALLPLEAEFGRAPWQLGQQAYRLLGEDHLGCSGWREGRATLGILHLPSRRLHPQGDWAAVHSLAEHRGRLVAIAEPTTRPGQLLGCAAVGEAAVAEVALGKSGTASRPRVIEQLALPDSLGSVIEPQHLQIGASAISDTHSSTHLTSTSNPHLISTTLYGLLYRPPQTSDERLPLIIQLHGGPTAQADGRFDPLKQFWLQRGFALLDLNYRGSSGYGRHYRQQLQGQWGVTDVEDVIAAARFFIDQGWVDPEQVLVRGNSAGGYTVLQVLSLQAGQQWVRAGASHYGISDLERLASQTHKFESQYLNWLIGDLPQQRDRYRLRSPIHRVADFSRPLIFFQGGLDNVVPATQTYRLYNQLQGRGVPVDYLAFADERHGFRQAKNRARVLERELDFYCEQLGLAV
ncbi:MAG: dipeptidyl aminopeptidase/acylaminoacyl peptidase [Motiliproteus sp.]|jgi:dipeptidyl aminopeptidase/acylaminoacyl peptidase